MASIPIIASSTLFFCIADRERWYWVIGVWMAWIAYVGVNVCQPNLMLKLAPAPMRPAYVAAYQTASGLCVAASMIAGGMIFDRLRQSFGSAPMMIVGGTTAIDVFQLLFLFGFVTRAMSVLVLLLVREPMEKDQR